MFIKYFNSSDALFVKVINLNNNLQKMTLSIQNYVSLLKFAIKYRNKDDKPKKPRPQSSPGFY